MNWQEEVAREMKKWGFQRGRYNPCLYWRRDDYLLAMVHGDDFVSVGSRVATSKFRKQLEARFEIKTQVIGPEISATRACTADEGDESDKVIQEGRVLNRVTRWITDGWEIEPDQRHADIIVHELGLHDSKPVST